MRGSWQRSVTVVLTVAATLALMAEENEATATGNARVACAALLVPNDTTEMVGLTFKDDDIHAAITEFDDGKVDEAIDRLTKLTADRAAGDKQRQNELRTARAMLLIRRGTTEDTNTAKGLLSSITSLGGTTDVAQRAAVIRLVSDNRPKEGTLEQRDLRPSANWIEHLRQARRKLENRMNEEEARLATSVPRKDWGGIEERLKLTAGFAAQMEAIKLDGADTNETISGHGERVRSLAKELAKEVDDALTEIKALKQQGVINPPGRKGGKGKGGYKKAGEINEWITHAQTCEKYAKYVKEHYSDLRTGRTELLPPLKLDVKEAPKKFVD